MGTERITTITLVCDACGKRNATDQPTALMARVATLATGWHFAEGRVPGADPPTSRRGHSGRRQFDYCPDCWPTSYHATH